MQRANTALPSTNRVLSLHSTTRLVSADMHSYFIMHYVHFSSTSTMFPTKQHALDVYKCAVVSPGVYFEVCIIFKTVR